jgi:WD40 repeat protein
MSRPLPRLCGLLLIFILLASSGYAQGFGKNKVQYENWTWYTLKSEHFDIYFYAGAEELAHFTAIEAERALSQIARDFHYEVEETIPLIVYKSHNDFQTTNVTPSLLPEGVGGFTEYLKHRVVVPYEGDYKQFRHVLHHELIHAVMFDMLYGRSIANLLAGQHRLQLPLWFNEGLAEWASEGWNTKADMFIRDAVMSGTLPPLEYLGGYFAYKGGQSVFRFLSNRYGREEVGELLSNIRSLRRLEPALEKTSGMTLEELDRNWQKAMRREYWPEIANRAEPEEFARRLTDHRELENYYNTSPAISPDGSRVAFLSDRDIYADLFLLSTIDRKVLRRLVKGQRSGKFEELHWLRPGISWSPEGDQISLAAKAGAHDHLFVVRAKDGKITREIDFDLDGLFSPAWSPLGNRIAFVGLRDGASDIYFVDLTDESLHQVTNDPYSDTDPSWSPDGETIVFVSERPGVIEPAPETVHMWQQEYEHSDIYTIRADGSEVKAITDDRFVKETPIFTPDGGSILYTSDPSGCFNIYAHSLESGEHWPITNVLTGAFDLSISRDGSLLVFASLSNAGWDIFELSNPLSIAHDSLQVPLTAFRESHQPAELDAPTLVATETQPPADPLLPEPEQQVEPQPSRIPVLSPQFSEFVFTHGNVEKVREVEGPKRPTPADTTGTKEIPALLATAESDSEATDAFSIQRYKPHFSPDLIYGTAAYSQYYGVVGASQIALSDVLGNHQIYLATNLYFSLSNSDFYAAYYYLPNRNDYGFSLFHNAFVWYSDKPDFVADKLEEDGRWAYTPGDFIFFRDRYYGGGIALRRPVDRFHRIELDFSTLFIDREFLDLNVHNQHRRSVNLGLSYVTDTTLWGITGPMGGGASRFALTLSPDLGPDYLSFATLQTDIRRYHLIGKDYAFAGRLVAGASFGNNPQQFFLGGMSNWLNLDWRESYRIESLDDLYFSSFVTPLRGARYYEQIGRRVALTNLEFRFPLLRHLLLGFPLPLEIGNIRGALFVDAGSAWNNNSDWRLTRQDSAGRRYLDDLLLGYGIGARWNLGFFVLMLDVAWRDDLVRRSPPHWYLTLGPEF